jgi:AAHS family 4-hydroxybenzoate transporter-like MFS transporter
LSNQYITYNFIFNRGNEMSQAITMDVQSYIDEQRLMPYQWLILLLGFLIVAVDGFDTAAIGYIAPSLIHEWNVPRALLGPVLSAALIGLAIGGISGGPIADRLGRKLVLVTSVFFFGVWSLVSSYSTSLESLTVFRFLTGLGLGAAMPNAVTLMSEFSPERSRSVLVNTMFCGFPLGASGGGFLASWLIPAHGWRPVLVVGGLMPLVLSVLMLLLLPESVRFLVARKRPVEKIRKIIHRIFKVDFKHIISFTISETKLSNSESATGLVLSKPYRLGSGMLWATYFLGLVIIYLLISWMPLLFKDAGYSMGRAAFISALFTLGGGLGAVFSGWMMGKFNPFKVVAATYALTGILLYATGQSIGSQFWLGMLVFVMGIAMNGAQTSMPSLATGFYPTQGRVTGVAWMMGIGRFGGIAGALFGAEMIRRHFGFDDIFAILAFPAFFAAGALLIMNLGVSAQKVKSPESP